MRFQGLEDYIQALKAQIESIENNTKGIGVEIKSMSNSGFLVSSQSPEKGRKICKPI